MNDKRFLKLADQVAIALSVLVMIGSSVGIVKAAHDFYARPAAAPAEAEAEASTEPVQLFYITDEGIELDAVEPEGPTPEPAEGPDEQEPILQITEDFVNQEPVKTYLGRYYVTGYDICVECCGKIDGITASGTAATVGHTVSAGPEIPFGTTLYIDGIGERVVEDRGSGVTEGCLDVLCENHAACYATTGWYDVYIMEG